MKSAQLVTFLTIASLMVGCGSQEAAVDDAGGLPAQAKVSSGSIAAVDSFGEGIQQLPKTPQGAATSAQGLEGFVSNHNSLSKSSQAKASQAKANRQSSSNMGNALKAPASSSVLVSSRSGRDNPFALAEQPDFEVRFVTATAPASLPPVPNVGLGPEVGASLVPVSSVAEPIELRPAAPTVVVPREQPGIAFVPNPQLALPPSSSVLPSVVSPASVLPVAISPTALAEAVEIEGVVQLGDQIAVIVNEGDGTLSRTVQAGARLVGGQVELRRIETTTAEPQVVLVQNGVEIVRGVGV